MTNNPTTAELLPQAEHIEPPEPDLDGHMIDMLLDRGDGVRKRTVPVLIPTATPSDVVQGILHTHSLGSPFGEGVDFETDSDIDWILKGVRADTGESTDFEVGAPVELDLREYSSFKLSPRVSGG